MGTLRRKRWIIPAGVMLAAGGTVLAWFWTVGSRSNADPANIEQAARGETVYAENCASCHGTNLEGQPDWRSRKPDGRLPAPPHDETGHTWHHADGVLFGITKNGLSDYAPAGYESDMPAFIEVLTDDQIWAVLAFIKNQWPAEIRARQSARDGSASRW